jgi:hypothetical protein
MAKAIRVPPGYKADIAIDQWKTPQNNLPSPPRLYLRVMKFKIGQKVRMKRTENYGEVTKLMPGDLVQVKLDGGLGHIPIPAEALEPAGGEKRETKHTPPPQQQSNAKVSGENGVQIAFDTVLSNEAMPVAYEVYLLNSTPHKIIYECKIMTHSDRRWIKVGQMDPNTKKRLEPIEYRWLNEKLSVELDIRTVSPGGTGPRHFQKVSIRGRQFFGKLTEVPELYREAHLYVVFPELQKPSSSPAPEPKGPTLKALTREMMAQNPPKIPVVKVERNNLRAKMDFENTIDLHLEALVRDPAEVPRNQVLSTQILHFENYLSMALKLGVDNVFVIHGVGDGILKREIHKILGKTRYVRKFQNDYNKKYGYGATEVIFD